MKTYFALFLALLLTAATLLSTSYSIPEHQDDAIQLCLLSDQEESL